MAERAVASVGRGGGRPPPIKSWPPDWLGAVYSKFSK